MMSLEHKIFQGRLRPILKKVSRTFYFSLKILPKGLKGPMALAYLLARAADTIADTRLIPAERRLHWLGELKICIQSDSLRLMGELFYEEIGSHQDIVEEKQLLERLDDLLDLLRDLSQPDDLKDIQSVLSDLIYGMEQDLISHSLNTMKDLEVYCHYAAGVVGPFWTRISLRHDKRLKGLDQQQMEIWGEEFGRGLQLINVIKDMAKDYQLGRCYLPADELRMLGLFPQDLGSMDKGALLKPLIDRVIQLSWDLLKSGEQYLAHLPKRCYTLRLSVLWPLWIGLATLRHLRQDEALLDPQSPHKISKPVLKAILVKSLFWVWSPRRLESILSSIIK
jgi:farnesyl-diphosphate farnesyltransferase